MTTVLLFLLCVVVEVHSQSQTYPFVRFGNTGPALGSHSYVNLTTVGYRNDGSDNIQCHTNLNTCCRAPFGDDRGGYSPMGLEYHLIEMTICFRGQKIRELNFVMAKVEM